MIGKAGGVDRVGGQGVGVAVRGQRGQGRARVGIHEVDGTAGAGEVQGDSRVALEDERVGGELSGDAVAEDLHARGLIGVDVDRRRIGDHALIGKVGILEDVELLKFVCAAFEGHEVGQAGILQMHSVITGPAKDIDTIAGGIHLHGVIAGAEHQRRFHVGREVVDHDIVDLIAES